MLPGSREASRRPVGPSAPLWAVLSPSELIPVVSYLIQKGRCKHCGERISGGYLLVELSTAVTFVLFYRYFGLNIVGILNMILALHFTVLAGIRYDARSFAKTALLHLAWRLR